MGNSLSGRRRETARGDIGRAEASVGDHNGRINDGRRRWSQLPDRELSINMEIIQVRVFAELTMNKAWVRRTVPLTEISFLQIRRSCGAN